MEVDRKRNKFPSGGYTSDGEEEASKANSNSKSSDKTNSNSYSNYDSNSNLFKSNSIPSSQVKNDKKIKDPYESKDA